MTRTIHNTENGLFRVEVVDVGADGEESTPLTRVYAIINNEHEVAEYTGQVLANVLALSEIFDTRLHKFNQTGSIKDEEDEYLSMPTSMVN